MKSWIVNVSILLGVVCSSYFYRVKFAVPGKEDMLITSLSGIHKYLPPGAKIKMINMVAGTVFNPQREIFPSFISYIIPPAIIHKGTITAADTVLVLLPANSPPSVRDSLLQDKTTLWQNADTEYQYILIH